jgi:hypothetical protein
LVVENHKVSVANIETTEMIACVFGIKNVFVDDKCCPACVRCVATRNKNKSS